MSAKRTQARIKVQVAVMVNLGPTRGPDSTIAQVRRQGEEEAINRLQRCEDADPHQALAGVVAHEIVVSTVDA